MNLLHLTSELVLVVVVLHFSLCDEIFISQNSAFSSGFRNNDRSLLYPGVCSTFQIFQGWPSVCEYPTRHLFGRLTTR